MRRVKTRLSKNAKVPWRIIEDEAVLVDIEEGEVVRLGPVGAEIWKSIDGKRTVDEIVDHICGTFDVGQWRAHRDVHRFITELLRHEYIEEH